MDYEFFESLTADEPRQFLSRFLETEIVGAQALIMSAAQEGISGDYQIESLVPMLSWVLARIKTVASEPDNSLPDWIRNSSSYTDNLFDFDNESKILILRSSYYLGESFIRSFQYLSWAVGNPETALKNMPVVKGFRNHLELAPMLVLENIFGRILSGNGTLFDLREMVSYWASNVRKSKSK